MKRLLIAAILAAGPALAEESPFLKGAELKAEIEKNCADGCVTFNREEAKRLEAVIEQIQKHAFAAGYKEGQATCKRRDI